jgi:hypothetical protein
VLLEPESAVPTETKTKSPRAGESGTRAWKIVVRSNYMGKHPLPE